MPGSERTECRVQSRDQHRSEDRQDDGRPDVTKYLRFGAMILTSMVFMYWVTFVGSWELGHVQFSQSRVFMALTMGGTMDLVMLAWMLDMYRDLRVCDLAVEISEAQRREILEMVRRIDDIGEHGAASTPEEAQERPVPDFDVAAERTCGD
jgi:hypothetical protein